MEQMILCYKCNTELPSNQFLIWKSGIKKGQMRRPCKQCMSISHKKWINDHKEDQSNKFKVYYQLHKERYKEHKKRNYLKNRREHIAYTRNYQKQHIEQHKIYRRMYGKIVAHRKRQRNLEPLQVSSVCFIENYNHLQFDSSSFHCEYCSAVISNGYELEHIIPLSRSGDHSVYNLAISCFTCNRGEEVGKFGKLLEEWKPELVSIIENRNNIWKKILLNTGNH